jgi:hypothetical protein
MVPLRLIWAVLDFPCGKRLARAVLALVESLERHRELDIDAPVRAALWSISAATIDRRLTGDRRRPQINQLPSCA